jgi:hypothetical protein
MAFPDYERDLLDNDVDPYYILDRYFHSGQSAVFESFGCRLSPSDGGREADA